ncbi:hypothetical protein OXX59_002764 [Metschnikowia pulcherrima]
MRLLAIISICAFSQYFRLATSLSILVSTTDSWVDKNVRYLYPALFEAGHEVLFVGSLNSKSVENYRKELFKKSVAADAKDFSVLPNEGGAFGHLKDSHQKYHLQIRKQNTLSRGAKKVISEKASKEYESEFERQKSKLVSERAYGQDPLNPNFWYVNGSPLEALSIAFNVILPKHRVDFKPDLVLLGPNEGLHLSHENPSENAQIAFTDLSSFTDELEAMRLLAQAKNYPVISVSTEDADHVYYEDEAYFHVEQASYGKMFKQNAISQNIKFVNMRILDLITEVVPQMKRGQALNVNFPSMNRDRQDSTCVTKGHSGPEFKQVTSFPSEQPSLGHIFVFPEYDVEDGLVHLASTYSYKASKESPQLQKVSNFEVSRLQHLLSVSGKETNPQNVLEIEKYSENVARNEVLENNEEFRALQRCEIAISISSIVSENEKGFGEGPIPELKF